MAKPSASRYQQVIHRGLLLATVALAALPAHAEQARYDSGGTDLTHNIINEAYRAAYHGHLSEAIADMTRALTAQPNYAYAYMIRGHYYQDEGLYDLALADYDTAASFHPQANDPVLGHIQVALMRGEPALALQYLAQNAKLPTISYWRDPHEASTYEPGSGASYYVADSTAAALYADESIAAELLKQDDLALTDLDHMMNLQSDFPAHVLAYHCHIAGVAGLTEMADLTCTQAIAEDSHDLGDYDSLAFVHLKMKDWANAIADYNKALSFRPDLTLSLYGRGVAKLKMGDIAGGNADIAAATAGEPDIANIMKRLGAPTP